MKRIYLVFILVFCSGSSAHDTQKQPQVDFSQLINFEEIPGCLAAGAINGVVLSLLESAYNLVSIRQSKYDLDISNVLSQKIGLFSFIVITFMESSYQTLNVVLPTWFINLTLENISQFFIEDGSSIYVMVNFSSRVFSSALLSFYFRTSRGPLQDLINVSFYLVGVNTFIDYGVIATFSCVSIYNYLSGFRLRRFGW